MTLKRRKLQTIIDPISDEVWVPIFRNYEISNMGRIKSNKWGYDILLKTYKNNRNYDCIDFRVNCKKKKSTVHKLVALIFLKNIDPKRITVNHHFGKDDNRAQSLSWMTYSENTRHGVDNGMIHRGVAHYASQLDEMQVRTIKSMRGELPYRVIADYFKVKINVIGAIMQGKAWKHLFA